MAFNSKYGWKPSPPDQRDVKFGMKVQMLSELPESVDLSPMCQPVYDQKSLGSCTSQSAAALASYLMKKLDKTVYTPSRLAIYYWERELEGTVNSDSGAYLRDAMKVMAQRGCPNESLWEYDVTKFKKKPSKKVEEDGKKHLVSEYMRLDNSSLFELKNCLAMGYPFIFGFMVYESFEKASWHDVGIMPIPEMHERIFGGHAVCSVGFSDEKQAFLIRNSWGEDWCKKGYFWMPYSFISNKDFCDDFWTGHQIT